MFGVTGTSQWAVYKGFCGSKPGFHFLLHAHAIGIPRGKKTKQKEGAPATQPIFPAKRTIQPL